MNEITVPWSVGIEQADLFGIDNINISLIENAYGVSVGVATDAIIIKGKEDDCKNAAACINTLMKLIAKGQPIDKNTTSYVISTVSDGVEVADAFDETVCHTNKGKPIKSKTMGQKKYIEAIKKNDIVFCIGPAGTGKTYLAMAMAVNAFKNSDVSRIVLVRPAVEAGERLGFLPGDMKEKVDPYLRPLYDALYDIMGSEAFERNLMRGTIEIAPLAYMRGRTLDDCFIILDEAQNTTSEQMKMFLTRLGFGSKAVITGDITQIDLPFKEKSSLFMVENILNNVDGIKFINMTQKDVVRNPIVQRIINAYEKFEAN